MLRRKLLRWRRLILLGLIVIVLGSACYAVWIEPYNLRINHVWIEDSQLAKVLGDKIVVHLSDLHIKVIGNREQKVLDLLDQLKPDLIFLTGDYVPWSCEYEEALNFLSRLRAKEGMWAVMGDYDYSCSRKSCLFCHEQGSGEPTKRHSIHFLRNSCEEVSFTNGSSLWIGGVDINNEGSFFSDKKLFPLEKPSIILSHNPLAFDHLDKSYDVLMLAGDTHGGQIPLPSWFWKILRYKKIYKYSHGFFEKGQKKMFVSKGIGTSHLPIRIFRRPEVVVLHFKLEGNQ